MITVSEENRAVALEVAEKLGETEANPIEQIALIIEKMGVEFVQKKVEQALKIQQDGGLSVHRGSRRRTLGGVFFYVVKADLEPDVIKQIFPEFGKEIKRILQWDERIQELADVLKHEDETPGEMRKNPQIVVEGRPNQIKMIENTIVAIFDHQHKETPYPKGVPTPPENLQASYVLYMGYRQWQKVEIAVKNPEDYLIAQGYPIWDTELGVVAVLVQKLTTKLLDQARRAQVANPQIQRKPKKDANKPQSNKQSAKIEKASKTEAKGKKQKASSDGYSHATPKGSSDKTPPAEPIKKTETISVDIPMPEGITPGDAAKLRQLHSAAETFKERIALMESKGQVGIDMTRRLLANTEKQIDAIMNQYR